MLAGSTLVTLRTAVKNAGYDQITPAIIDEAIRAAIKRILNAGRWPWRETQSTTLTTTVANPSVALATADIVHVHSVRLQVGTAYTDLEYRTLEELRRLRHLNRDTATPSYWSQGNGTLEFFPIPDKAYTVVLDYANFPTTLPTADGDVSPIPSAWDDTTVWGAVSKLAFRQRDVNAKNQADGEFLSQLRDMKGAYNIRQRQSSDQVARSSFWDDAAR